MPLAEGLEVDVLVVGGGITGVTAAYLLAKEGLSVALLERDRLGARDTGHTTAHLTYMTDVRLSDLVSTHNRDAAKQAWDAGLAAMELIESNVEELGIDCSLAKVSGYLATAKGDDPREESTQLNHEAILARQMGFDAHFIDSDPVTHRPGIRFGNQMEFHPLRYIDALASAAVRLGAKIFGDTEVTEFPEEGMAKSGPHQIRYRKAFIATHVPLQGTASTVGAALFQTKLALYTTYAVRADMNGLALPEMIWSDTGDPFLYLRIQNDRNGPLCILGGEDNKTGQEDSAESRFRNLERELQRLVPGASVTHRWCGQVVETVDGLPFIGPTSEREFIATGFSGNGMTYGTAAAIMFRDWITGDRNPWARLFDPSRRTASALGEHLRENKDYPVRMVTGRLHLREGSPTELRPGEAALLKHDGDRIAAHRSREGELSVCSAICPHMGCVVAWNDADETWDCPCHGSRFRANGDVIAGPAETGLKPLPGKTRI